MNLNKLKVIKIFDDTICFENNITLYSYHEQDCCESHYLSTNDLSIEDFDGLEFNLENDNFFKRIDGYGIELIPNNGHSIKIPGYGANNGYYSEKLDLILFDGKNILRRYDITECQDTNYS